MSIVLPGFFNTLLDWTEELCAPYLRWARELVEPGDYVITFNYDLAEKIGIETGKLVTVIPEESPTGQYAPVLKLHGSVNWVKAKNGRILKSDREDAALVCDNDALALATPGPGKLEVSQRLAVLWGTAELALERASSIVVVGFRFPPGDSHARARLLSAVTKNKEKDLRVHIVLGAKTGEADVLRTEKLFEFALTTSEGGRASDRRGTLARGRLLYCSGAPPIRWFNRGGEWWGPTCVTRWSQTELD